MKDLNLSKESNESKDSKQSIESKKKNGIEIKFDELKWLTGC